MEEETLSVNDQSVLHRIFNPHIPFDLSLDFELQPNGHHSNGYAIEEDTAEVREAKELERQGIEAANSGDHDQAVLLFNSAINQSPHRASAYNNRAQAYRLMHNTEGAMLDLDKALELSNGRGPAACQAYTQRAIIRKLQNDDEGATDDFKKAAALGGQFARSQLVALNPYAAMCGAAVAEMLQRERTASNTRANQ